MSSILFLIFLPDPALIQDRCGTGSEWIRLRQLAARIEPSWQTEHDAALCLLMNGQPDKTVELLRNHPCRTSQDKLILGIAYFQLGEFGRARDLLAAARGGLDQSRYAGMRQYADYYLGLLFIKDEQIEKARAYFSSYAPMGARYDLAWFFDGHEKLLSGRRHLTEGDFRRARDAYAACGDFFGYRELGLAHAHEGLQDFDSAIWYCDAVIRDGTDRNLFLPALFMHGRIDFMLKRYDRASIYLREYYDSTQADEAAYLAGLCLSNQAKYDSASGFFEILSDTVDDYLFYKGRTDYFKGQWGSAEERLLRHREYFPASKYADRALYILGTINFRRKEYQASIEFYGDLVNIFPASQYAASAMKAIADAHYSQADYRRALAAYRKVWNYEPSLRIRGDAALKIYETLFHLRRYPSMLAALRRFTEVCADSAYSPDMIPSVRLRIAKMLSDDGEYYQSLVELDKLAASEKNPALVGEALVERARVARKIGDADEEKRSYLEIVGKPVNRDYYTFAVGELASLYENGENYDSALYYYNLMLGQDKSREMAMYGIARLYVAIGQYSEAETMADRLLSEFPKSVYLHDAYILKSMSLRRRGKYDAALVQLKALAEGTDVKPHVYIEIGDIYMETQDFQKARDNYVAACDLYKQDRDGAARALLSAGDAARAMNDRAGAREYYLRGTLLAESIAVKDQLAARLTELE